MPRHESTDEYRRRRQVALALKREGLTFAEVGENLGVTKQRAKQLCDTAYAEEIAAFEQTKAATS